MAQHSFLTFVAAVVSSILVSSLVTLTFFAPIPSAQAFDIDKGSACAGCAIGVHLIAGWSETYEKPVDVFLTDFCEKYLPAEFGEICAWVVNNFGDELVQLLNNGATPDDACFELGFCRSHPQCKMMPDPTSRYVRKSPPINPIIGSAINGKGSPWDWIKDLIDRLADKHEPIFDMDGDMFSAVDGLRGANWRGKDCDEGNNNIYPGRKASSSDLADSDFNCNGIHGVDHSTGKTYKQQWCDESKAVQKGVLAIGGSATAHFHIPPRYLDSHILTPDTYSDLLTFLEDECDWPQYSCYTGHKQPKDMTEITKVDSFYLHLHEHNLCNHRDYQNMGVNGFSQLDVAKNIHEVRRNSTMDHPAIFFLSPWGDDICNSNVEDPLGHMSSVADFRSATFESLEYLNEILPAGSTVFFVGIIDGSVMGRYIINDTHPLGITYAHLYDYLSCLHVNPCTPWLQTNSTIRDAASAWAKKLNAQYEDIAAKNEKFYSNFDLHYWGEIPAAEIISEGIAAGKSALDFLEPVDGFHPSQETHRMMGIKVWEKILKQWPEVIGVENEFNAQIKAKFGDQDGY